MGGGMMQIALYGAQDIYLTGNPQMTYFKAVYRRHTNFAVESIEQPISGKPEFGKTFYCHISRNGDLLYRIFLEIDMTVKHPERFTRLGHQILEYAQIEIGGQMIDKQYGEWMDIWTQLSHNENQFANLDRLCNGSLPTLDNVSCYSRKLYVPLQFWFCRNPGLALPLIALQNHDIRIVFKLRDKNMIRDRYGVYLKCADKIDKLSFFCEYIYLDTDERRRFAQSIHEYLIEQIQYSNKIPVSEGNEDIRLNFNHPVKEIIWAITKGHPFGVNVVLNYPRLDDIGMCIRTTPDRYVYVAGFFQDTTIQFSDITLTAPANNRNLFIAKMSPCGQWLWAKQIGGNHDDGALELAIAPDGGAIITGYIGQDASGLPFINPPCDSSGCETNVFIAKISCGGIWQWANTAHPEFNVDPSGNAVIAGLGLHINNDGTTYLTGIFNSDKLVFGSYEIENTSDISNNDGFRTYDMFISKISTAGNWMWAVAANSNYNNIEHTCITGTSDGGAVFAGISIKSPDYPNTISSTTFGPFVLDSSLNYYFVGKISTFGEWVWVRKIDNIACEDRIFITTSVEKDAIYITGTFGNQLIFDEENVLNPPTGVIKNLFVAKISNIGYWVWVNQAGGTTGTIITPNFINYTLDNGVVIAGSFEVFAKFGYRSIQSKGAKDLFVAKVSSEGEWNWAASEGCDGEEGGFTITPLVDGTYMFLGYTTTPQCCPIADSSFNIFDNDAYSIFTAYLSSNGEWLTGQIAGNVYFYLSEHCFLDFWGRDKKDLVRSAMLELNGNNRIQWREGSYYRCVHTYLHHTGGIQDPDNFLGGFYVYSFALNPEQHQPSGTCNFSRFDNPVLYLDLEPEARAVQIWAVNYNVLRLMNGMAGLAYTS
jgi:hypothetical protein